MITNFLIVSFLHLIANANHKVESLKMKQEKNPQSHKPAKISSLCLCSKFFIFYNSNFVLILCYVNQS